MAVPQFDPKELKVVREIPVRNPPGTTVPVYDFPLAPRDGYQALIKREPYWQTTNVETSVFTPQIYPDNVARAFVLENNMIPREKFGGKDAFGVEWVYVDVAGGSMVKPGAPLLSEAAEWKDKVVIPNIDSWDWAASAAANKDRLENGVFHQFWIMNGFFERLISFMDFEGAALALMDEDQRDDVKAIFSAITDFYIKLVDKFVDNYHAQGFTVHDDWGSQMAPFFSPAAAKEMIVPYMRRLTDHIHSRGCLADFHSCGHIEQQVPNMIAAGWDSWSGMKMNDTQKLYEIYGDKIIIGVVADQFDPEKTSLEDQKAAARDYVKRFCNPKKPALFNNYGNAVLTPAYREELYRQSRIVYGGGGA